MVTNKKIEGITKYKWVYDGEEQEDIYYDRIISIFNDYSLFCYGYDESELVLPEELKECLERIRKFLWDDMGNVYPPCPVKGAHIEFIYKDEVYNISPNTFGLIFGEVPGFYGYEHAVFEFQSEKIRKMLKEILGITNTKYYGFID